MPTAVVSNARQSAATPKKPSQRSKKSRLVRRRGRIHDGSDDEIEREARSDSDSDDDSSLDSGSDSETASDDEPHAGIVTPSTTQSPPPPEINGESSTVKPDPIDAGGNGPFTGATDWAQIVADENATGTGELPVIDFADMHPHAVPGPVRPQPRSKKAQKAKKAAATQQPIQEQSVTEPDKAQDEPPHPADDVPEASASAPTAQEFPQPRSRGQSVRQAYQERLRQDPAYVPRVGEFWGHDDRLLDKDLRSMSGWWRGRWHNRGRGRGTFPPRGRGGRGFFAGRVPSQEGHEVTEETEPASAEDVPPIERAWGHDGFEEMKRREEQRPLQAQSQRGAAPRGRAGFTPRGRSGIVHGGGPASPSTPNSISYTDPFPKRAWFAMKPEKVWTKHGEWFLYMDAPLRSRHGQNGNVRVKLPGRAARILPAQQTLSTAGSTGGTLQATAPSTATSSTDEGERQFVVRFPKAASQQADQVTESEEKVSVAQRAPETELSIDEVFTVRPHAVPSYVPLDVPKKDDQSQPTTTQPPAPPVSDASSLPEPDVQRQLEQLGLGIGNTEASSTPPSAILEETLLRHPPHEDTVDPSQPSSDESRVVAPALHPLQTSFSPVPPTSPPYGSPYGFASSLPPGIAISPQGFPYEITTGRPVYLQHAPPTMYAPQPGIHGYMAPPPGMPFVPRHMSQPSQEYVPQPHTPVNGFIDPATGVPIFSPARQNSRIEIRAPTDRSEGVTAKSTARPSNLRASVTEGESDTSNGFSNEEAGGAQGPPQGQHVHPTPQQLPMVPYPPYPAQYYYPDPIAYNAYMDMTPQMHYEVYPPHDQRSHQPVIYY